MYRISLKKKTTNRKKHFQEGATGGWKYKGRKTSHFTPFWNLWIVNYVYIIYSKNSNKPNLSKCYVGQWKVEATIPEAAIRPSSGAFGLPVARTAKIRPSLVRMYVPKEKHEEDYEAQTCNTASPGNSRLSHCGLRRSYKSGLTLSLKTPEVRSGMTELRTQYYYLLHKHWLRD